jgi:hypothetical protein
MDDKFLNYVECCALMQREKLELAQMIIELEKKLAQRESLCLGQAKLRKGMK